MNDTSIMKLGERYTEARPSYCRLLVAIEHINEIYFSLSTRTSKSAVWIKYIMYDHLYSLLLLCYVNL